MPTTSPVRIQADIPAVAFDVPTGTDILTVPPPTPLADPTVEKITMFGADVLQRYPIVDHSATDTTTWRLVARTASGTNVYINTRYLDADVKILTSEIKPHFMAGFSGGRKAISPGLANLATLQKFHSPQFLEHPCATHVLLKGNPCHQEATEVAERVGADFLINVTMNKAKKLTGVYAGHWCLTFAQVTSSLAEAVSVPCTTGINPGNLETLPLTSGYTYTSESRLEWMVPCAIQRTLATWQQRLDRPPRVGVIRDGAHAIPRLIEARATI